MHRFMSICLAEESMKDLKAAEERGCTRPMKEWESSCLVLFEGKS